MSKKKLITIVSIILAVILVAGGGYFVFQNINGQNGNPTPVKTSPAQTEEEEQAELDKLLEEFKNSEDYIDTISKYSQYLNIEESTPGDIYDGQLVVPSIRAVSKYVEEGYFNPYFVSNFWVTKDSQSPNSIDSFLGDYITDSFKENLTIGIPDNINNRVYVPDANFGIPVGCAEDWTDYECFAIPSAIKKITYKGMNVDTAIYTVEFQINVNVQDANQPVGAYTNQQRNYKVDFTVTNTNPKAKVPNFTDIKINEVSPSLEIINNADISGEQNND